MRAPRYAAYQLDGVHGGKLLEWHDDSETYRAIADFPQAVRASLVADELNAAEARREADERAREAELAKEEPREVQLDALVDRADSERHPELHVDRRPDSYGELGEDRMGRDRGVVPVRPARSPVIGFAGRVGNGYSPGFGALPPDGTVPGR